MIVRAYCAAQFAGATARAAGVQPLLAPPLSMGQFNYQWLEGADLLYFALHGFPDNPIWYGDGGLTAISADQVRRANLSGAVVFAAGCYAADGQAPMFQAFRAAGARAIVGGAGLNFSGFDAAEGAALLGLWFRRGLQWGLSVSGAFLLGKARLLAHLPDQATRDTLHFQLFRG